MKQKINFQTYSYGIWDYYIVSGKEKEKWIILRHIKLSINLFIFMLFICIFVTSILYNMLPLKIVDFIFSSTALLYGYYTAMCLICVICIILGNVRFYYRNESKIAFEDVVDGKIIKYERVFFLPYNSSFKNILAFAVGFNIILYTNRFLSKKYGGYYTIGINENNEMKCKCGACGEIFSITNNTLYTLCPHCYTQNWIQALTDPNFVPHFKINWS